MKTIQAILFGKDDNLEVKVSYSGEESEDGRTFVVNNCIVTQDRFFRCGDIYADVQKFIEDEEKYPVSISCEIIQEVKEQVQTIKSIAA
jgi:hypothetical protein